MCRKLEHPLAVGVELGGVHDVLAAQAQQRAGAIVGLWKVGEPNELEATEALLDLGAEALKRRPQLRPADVIVGEHDQELGWLR